MEAVGQQSEADQHQERERQHLGGRMRRDEARRPGRTATYITIIAITTAAIMISMSSAMPIAVTIESIENTRSTTTSCDDHREGALWTRHAYCASSSRLDLAVDFVRRLGDQEQSAADQDDVAPGEADSRIAANTGWVSRSARSGRSSKMRKTKASERPICRARAWRCASSARHQHRDEHEIVDAEHDFERGQRQQRGPSIGVC